MENLTIKGNEINAGVLEEIKSVLTKPMERKIVIVALLAYAAMVISVIYSGQLGWIPLLTAANLFYIFGQPAMKRNQLMDKILKGMRRTYGRESCAFDVTFEAENIKSISVQTRETVRMPYADFTRMKKAKHAIALVTRQGQMVVLDRGKMDEETEKAALAIVKEKCVNIPKR